MYMHIYDTDGKQVKVSNLPKAITIAREFMEFEHTDPTYAQLDHHLRTHWSAIHTKLLQLQQSLQRAPMLNFKHAAGWNNALRLLKNISEKEG